MTDSQELIDRWRLGDQDAAAQLYARYRDRTFRLVMGLLNNIEDAEEVAQDTLTYALLNIDRYDADRAKFTTWLHTIAVSRSRDKQRRKRFLLVSLSDWLQGGGDASDSAPTPENWLNQKLSQEAIWGSVHKLPPQLREAILLRHWAQHSFKEIAEILGCPTGTAQSRVRRGYEKLRQILGESG